MSLPTDPFRFEPLAGSGIRDYIDGPAHTAAFISPMSCDLSLDGETLYVTDHGAQAIRTVSTSNGTVGTLAVLAGAPQMLCVGPVSGNIYVVRAEPGNMHYSYYTGFLDKYAPNGTLLASAILSRPSMRGVGISPDETKVYVNWVLSDGGWSIPHVDLVGTGDIGLQNPAGFIGHYLDFRAGGSIAVGPDGGNVWFTDSDFGLVERYASSGLFVAGQQGVGSGLAGRDIKRIRTTDWIIAARSEDGDAVIWDAGSQDPFATAPDGVTFIAAPIPGAMQSVAGADSDLLYAVTGPYYNNRSGFGGNLYDYGPGAGPADHENGVISPLGGDAGDDCKVWRLRTRTPALRVHQRDDQLLPGGSPRIPSRQTTSVQGSVGTSSRVPAGSYY